MGYLKIERTEDTPEVLFDGENGELFMAGISFPDNVERFYTPIMMWLDEYIQTPLEITNVIFKFEYFNTSSSKKFLDILLMFQEIHQKGFDVEVEWYHQKDDVDLKDAGMGYADLVDLPFKYKEI